MRADAESYDALEAARAEDAERFEQAGGASSTSECGFLIVVSYGRFQVAQNLGAFLGCLTMRERLQGRTEQRPSM